MLDKILRDNSYLISACGISGINMLMELNTRYLHIESRYVKGVSGDYLKITESILRLDANRHKIIEAGDMFYSFMSLPMVCMPEIKDLSSSGYIFKIIILILKKKAYDSSIF